MTSPEQPSPRRPFIVRAIAGAYRRGRQLLGRARRSIESRVNARAERQRLRGREQQLRLALRGTGLGETLLGVPNGDALAVVMCLWNRPERITAVLTVLDQQSTARRLRLILWNNQPRDSAHYREAIRAFRARGQLDSVEFIDSEHNIGGIGRFVALRRAVQAGYGGTFVMIDDDQDVSPDFIDDVMAVAAPRTVAGLWAWKTRETYWDRERSNVRGEPVSYVGTGGCVCDSELVTHDEFFAALPARYLFMEDMWMSWLAAANGWRVLSAPTPVEFVLGETDQYHSLIGQKQDFFQWLSDERNLPRWTTG